MISRCHTKTRLTPVLIIMLFASVSSFADEIPEIFVPVTGIVPASLPQHLQDIAVPGTAEQVFLNLNPLISPAGKFDEVRMTFQGNAQDFVANRLELDREPNDAFVWMGRPDHGIGSIVLSIAGDAVYGMIELESETYRIEPSETPGIYWLYEVDHSRSMPICSAELPVVEPVDEADVKPSSVDEASFEVSAAVNNRTVVDALILYTNGFAAKYPGDLLRAQINFHVGIANLSYLNSNVDIYLRLVATRMVNFPDTGELDDPLADLKSSSNEFAFVNGLRNQVGADVVSLLRVFDSQTNNACGLAYVMQNTVGFAGNTFSVVQVGIDGGFYCTDQTFVHEVGHNMGLQHNIGDPGLYSYSVGYRFPPALELYRTVMAYSPGSRVSYFSNPNVRYEGYATGQSGVADCARSLNDTKEIFRDWAATQIAHDVQRPVNTTGNAFINDGADYTNLTAVNLALSATDNLNIRGYYISTSPTAPQLNSQGWSYVYSETGNYSETMEYELNPGSGTKTLYVWFRDDAGGLTASTSDSITLDTVVPKNKTKKNFINGGAKITADRSLKLKLIAADNKAVAGYYISEKKKTPTADQKGWTSVATKKKYKKTVEYSLKPKTGKKTLFVWFKDAAGNVSKVKSGKIELLK